MDTDPAKYAMYLLPPGKREDVRAMARGCLVVRQQMLGGGCCSEGRGLPAEMDEALRRYEVPRQAVLDFVNACAADATTTRYATFSALRRHCEGVGGNASMMIACVLGVTHSDALSQAKTAGAAMRLTSILRDLGSDLAAGRLYLPIEDLVRHGVRDRELLTRSADAEAVGDIVRANVKRARELLAEAGEGLPWIAPDGSRAAAGVMMAITAATLDAIEVAGAGVLHKPPKASGFGILRRIGDAWRMAHGGRVGLRPDRYAR